jgi:hypothetical protein
MMPVLPSDVTLTFHPELVDASVHLRRLEADAERCEHQDSHEEHLPGVAMQEAAELEQLALEARSEPQSSPIPGRFTLQQYEIHVTLRTVLLLTALRSSLCLCVFAHTEEDRFLRNVGNVL